MNDHTTAEVFRIPDCDLCPPGTPAVYDAKTNTGPWAYLCQHHYERFGLQLGLGWGQRLVLAKEGA